MRRFLTGGALALSLALCASSPSALASTRKGKRESAEHAAAVKKCNEEYEAAVKSARGEKGKARRDALRAAASARRQCKAGAPK